MVNSYERSFGQKFNTWIQTFGIIIAAAWGVYTFIFKEIIIPKATPINITLSLQLHKIGEENIKIEGEKSLIAIEMKVSATNPSSRTVYLLPNIWVAYGKKIVAINNDSFNDRVADALQPDDYDVHILSVERHSEIKSASMVAVGRLFIDNFLRPGEKALRTLIFHVPAKKYDLLEVFLMMPTVADYGLIELEWKLDDNQEGVIIDKIYSIETQCVWWTFCIRKTPGERKLVEKDKSGYFDFKNQIFNKAEYQMQSSTGELSLLH
jgi:hypothetical protein